MLPTNLDALTSTERLIIEQAYLLSQELKAASDSAPKGQLIDRCEQVMLDAGRDFLRRVLEGTLQSGVDAAQEKKGMPADVRVGRPRGTRA